VAKNSEMLSMNFNGGLYDGIDGRRKNAVRNLSTFIYASALISIVIVTATVLAIPSIHYSSPHFNFYFPVFLDMKVVEASSANKNTTTSVTPANASLANLQNSTTRSYTDPLFGISVEYPSNWSAFEMNSPFPSNDSYVVALIRAPLENSTDKFAERILFGVQYSNLDNVTLDTYTSESLAAYRNTSGLKILESTPITLSNQPAHRIVYTDDNLEGFKLKKIQAWTVINNSRIYVITFGGEESKYSDYLPQVQNIISSFSTSNNNTINNQQLALQQETNLTFDDPAYGIKSQYPSSWIKIQPGQPSIQDDVDVIVAFLRPEVQQNISSALTRIGIGVQHLISQSISLDQYTSNQIETINRQNATMLESSETTLAGIPAHRAVFTLQDTTKLMQIWALKDEKAYIITYQANLSGYPEYLPTFQRMVESLQIA
jgi:hypothetical protein